MFINYKKRYKRILEIIDSEMKINYQYYKDFLENRDYEKVINDDLLKDQMIIDNLKSMDKYRNRYLSLYNLDKRIKREFEK